MKGDAKVIKLLNEVLAAELTAINQYFLHAELCENYGYEALYKQIRSLRVAKFAYAARRFANPADSLGPGGAPAHFSDTVKPV